MGHRTGTTAARTPPRVWPGVALVLAAVGFLVVEAVVAAAWDRRPYSYAEDYVNFLGSRFVGDFEGYSISSPLWLLMDVGWVASGLLIAGSTTRLAAAGSRWRSTLVAALGMTLVLALLVFAAFPLGPGTIAAGLLPLYLAGAFLSIIAGNGLAIVMSVMSERLGLALPRPVRLVGLALGVGGLLSIPATYGWLAIGVAERIPMYSFLAWAALTGSHSSPPAPGATGARDPGPHPDRPASHPGSAPVRTSASMSASVICCVGSPQRVVRVRLRVPRGQDRRGDRPPGRAAATHSSGHRAQEPTTMV